MTDFQTNILILYGQRFGLLKKLKQILFSKLSIQKYMILSKGSLSELYFLEKKMFA